MPEMNRLVAYDSDEESPEHRRRSRDESRLTHIREEASPHTSTERKSEDGDKKIRKNSERWTASGDEESEGSSYDSSGSHSESDSERIQPPPPKRFSPSPSERSVQSDAGMPPFRPASSSASLQTTRLAVTQSQSSLVSYGGQEDEEEEDEFAKADKNAVESKPKADQSDRSRSVTAEPKPPRGHEDSRSPDEIAVDSALEEGLRELAHSTNQQSEEGNSTGGELTPRSLDGNESPLNAEEEEEVKLPPSPPERCSEEDEERFRSYFERKAAGVDLNLMIQKRRDFKNPSMYEKLIEAFDVDELGSNFKKSVFDPHGFSKDCFYDQISIMQKEAMEKYHAAAEKKPAAPAAKVEPPKNADAKRKTRFEGSKKH